MTEAAGTPGSSSTHYAYRSSAYLCLNAACSHANKVVVVGYPSSRRPVEHPIPMCPHCSQPTKEEPCD
jgi:hypothetical protein